MILWSSPASWAQLVRVLPRKWMVVPLEAANFLWKITALALGELCCVALSFSCTVLCCVAWPCLSKHLIDHYNFDLVLLPKTINKTDWGSLAGWAWITYTKQDKATQRRLCTIINCITCATEYYVYTYATHSSSWVSSYLRVNLWLRYPPWSVIEEPQPNSFG